MESKQDEKSTRGRDVAIGLGGMILGALVVGGAALYSYINEINSEPEEKDKKKKMLHKRNCLTQTKREINRYLQRLRLFSAQLRVNQYESLQQQYMAICSNTRRSCNGLRKINVALSRCKLSLNNKFSSSIVLKKPKLR